MSHRPLLVAFFALCLILLFASCDGGETGVIIDEELYAELVKKTSAEITLDSNTAVKAARELAWSEYKAIERKAEDRVSEITTKAITYGEATMKFEFTVVGKSGADGYPLYIALHGGGGSDTPDINNSQWDMMTYYYRDSVKSGIYLAPRGVRDTWNTHFNDESYPLYERLIADLSIYYGIDTNRVYLLGYSAGGDGVYQITPRLADRFAAANMSAGHPNGVDLTNIYNVPLQIQCGETDSAYDRNKEDARYCEVLDGLSVEYGGGYTHNVYIHRAKGHNFIDNDPQKTVQPVLSNPVQWYHGELGATMTVDTNAISFLEANVRDPIPKRVVWNLAMRAPESKTESFYWLKAEKSVNSGVIVASYDTEKNTVTIEQCSVSGQVTLLLNEQMLNLFKPVKIIYNGKTTEYTVTPSLEIINETIAERSDPELVFAASITLDFN